jgi:hypothetical protein
VLAGSFFLFFFRRSVIDLDEATTSGLWVRGCVEAWERLWPHDWIDAWRYYFVAFDFNRDNLLCTFF